MFFAWWRKAAYQREGSAEELKPGTVAYFKEKQATLGRTFTVEQKLWYQDQAEDMGIFVKGQYPTDIDECFEAPVKGAIWAQSIANARSEGRIMPIAVNHGLEVDTFWDLGAPDNTATLYAQHEAGMRHVIDFDFGEHFDLPGRVRHMKKKQDQGFRYGTHYLPHDGAHRQKNGISFQSEFTAELKKQGVGGRVVGLKVTQDKWLSINHATQMLKHSRIDSVKAKVFIEAAELYRRKQDPNDDERFLDDVYNDWTCHCADAFRTMAEAALAGHLPFTSNGIMSNTYFDCKILAEFIKNTVANEPRLYAMDWEGEPRDGRIAIRQDPAGWLRMWHGPQIGQKYLVSLVHGSVGVWKQGFYDDVRDQAIPTRLVATCVDYQGIHRSQ